jgi:hypothetical protein
MRNTRSSVPSLAIRRVTPSASMIQSASECRAQIVSGRKLPTSTTART